MTVVVASIRERRMACNSMCIEGDGSLTPVDKIFRVRGTLVGIAGTLTSALTVVEWVRKGCKGAAPKGDCTLLLLGERKLSLWTPADGFIVVQRDWAAIGTGGPYAAGAMTMGADVRRAVRVAIEHDSMSAGRVVTRSLRRKTVCQPPG